MSVATKPDLEQQLVQKKTSPTRPGTATTTHASTTGSKLTYTLAGDSSPDNPLGARPRNPNIDYSYFPLERP